MFAQISSAVSGKRTKYQTPRARGECGLLSEEIFLTASGIFKEERLKIMVFILFLYNEDIVKRKAFLKEG